MHRITMGANRFRPNIVLKGGGPFEEDLWEEIDILPTNEADRNDATMGIQLVSKCTRCMVGQPYFQTGMYLLIALVAYRHPIDHWPAAKRASRNGHKRSGSPLQSANKVSESRSKDAKEGLPGG